VGEQDQIDATRHCHLAQRPVALTAGPGLDALPDVGPGREPSALELDRPALFGPTPAADGAVRQPGVGLQAQTVVDVQGKDLQPELFRTLERGMEQRRRIAAAAVGDADDATKGTGFSARWCR